MVYFLMSCKKTRNRCWCHGNRLLEMAYHATHGPPKMGPQDHLWQIMLLWVFPPDKVQLP